MPVFNCAKTLGLAIASILAQSFQEWELIIIDDGSTDNTIEVAESFHDSRIRVIARESNRGLAVRLNEAVALSRGEYFARMDGDDVSYPERFEKQLSWLQKHPEINLLGSSILIVNSEGRPIGIRRTSPAHKEICGNSWRGYRLPHVTWFGKRQWFRDNLYDPSAYYCQDRELLIRTNRTSTFGAIPDVLVAVSEGQLSLPKLLRSRRINLRFLIKEGLKQKDPALLLVAVSAEILKGVLDWTAVTTGLKYKLLRHRIPGIDEANAVEWRSVMNVLEGFAAKSPLDGKAHPDTQRRSQAGERALISIGMPVYNCATTVAQSIKSIINQTYDHWELIIIDDGSSDNTLEIVKTFSDPRIRLIEGGENQGLPARLNEAVSVSRGRFFARMDGDDVSYPERFELQLEYLKRHPDVDVLGGTILVFNNDGTAIGIRKAVLSHEEIRGAFWETFRLAHVTWLGKIEWFRRNSYRVSALNSQDRELLLRTHRFSRFAAIPEVLVAVREPNLSWKKLLPARTQHFSNLLRESVVQKDPKLLFLSAPAEIVKTAFDFIATHTGLGYRLLRHRLPPVDQELVARWQKLWAEVWNATTQPITNESVSPTKTLA